MFKKKLFRKRLTLRNLLGIKGGYAAFIDSIKNQIDNTASRYLIKEDEFKTELFKLTKLSEDSSPQLHYVFKVTTSLKEELGTIELYLGHGEHSYYLGHIVHNLKNHDYDVDIYRYLGKIFKSKGMNYIYIISENNPTAFVYNILGIYKKRIVKIPKESKFYRKDYKRITQYRYDL